MAKGRRGTTISQFGGASAVSLINAIASGVAAIAVARLLGAGGFGEYSYAVSIASFASLVFAMGTGITLRLRVARREEAHDTEEAFGTYSWVAGFFSGTGVSTVVLSFPPGDAAASWQAILAVFVFAAGQLLSRQTVEATQARGALLRSLTSSFVAAVTLSISALLASALWDAVQYSMALLLASIGFAAQIMFLRVARPHVGLRFRAESLRSAVGLAREGWRGMGFHVGLSAMQRAPRVLVVVMLGPTAGGIYAVAATLAESTRLLSGAMGQVLFLQVSGGDLDARGAERFRWFGVFVNVLAALVVGLIASPLIDLAFGPEYATASDVLGALLVAEIFMGMAIVDARIGLARGRMSRVGALSVTVALAAIGLIVVAGTFYAVQGILIATITSYVLFALAMRKVARTSGAVDV